MFTIVPQGVCGQILIAMPVKFSSLFNEVKLTISRSLSHTLYTSIADPYVLYNLLSYIQDWSSLLFKLEFNIIFDLFLLNSQRFHLFHHSQVAHYILIL